MEYLRQEGTAGGHLVQHPCSKQRQLWSQIRFLRVLPSSSLSEQPIPTSHFSLAKLRKPRSPFLGRYDWQVFSWAGNLWITQWSLVALVKIVNFRIDIGSGWQLSVSFLTAIFCETVTCIKWSVQVVYSICLELQSSLLYDPCFYCSQNCTFSSVFSPFPQFMCF